MVRSPQPQAQPQVNVLEVGNVAFFYRPKQAVLHPTNRDDLERVYFMLFPDDQQHHWNRLFTVAHGVFPTIVPGEALPEERVWAFSDDVSHDPRALIDALEKNIPAPPEPSGQRARPYARLAGDGRYAIARHEDHTHLAYRLHQPRHLGQVQQDLEIKAEASYILSVKEPFAPSEITLAEKPSYPESLRRKFDGLSFIAADPTNFLDYRRTQILLIGASSDIKADLGITIKPDLENPAEQQALQMLRQEAAQAQATWHVDILAPALTGKWE